VNNKKIAGQPFVRFEIWVHEIPAKLATQAAQRRGMRATELIAEVSSGVLVRGHIGKQLAFFEDWKMEKRFRQADSNDRKRARV
jgi:hypothetical protein